MSRIVLKFNVWDGNAELDSEGNVSSGKLWASVSYYPEDKTIRETRDGKRWRNEYGDEITYRDRSDVGIEEYAARLMYYVHKGYKVIGDTDIREYRLTYS